MFKKRSKVHTGQKIKFSKKIGTYFKAFTKLNLLFTYFRIAYHEWLYTVHLRIRKAHDNTYQKVNWYKDWTDKKYSSTIHKAVFASFVFSFVFFSVFQTILPFWNKPQKVAAASHSITWTTEADFDHNAVTTGTATQKSSGIVIGDTVSLDSQEVTLENNDFIQISGSGYDHALGLKSDGTVWAWGRNRDGQLGNGSGINSAVPIQVPGINDAIKVFIDDTSSMVLKSDGTVWAWGANYGGELGNGTYDASSVPQQIISLSGIVDIWMLDYAAFVKKVDGTIYAWGGNWTYQLGNGSTSDVLTPTERPDLFGFSKFSGCGWCQTTFGIKANGSMFSWGRGNYGSLGLGESEGIEINQSTTPAQIGSDTDWESVSSGFNHTIAIKTDGSLWAWGQNTVGQLGLGDIDPANHNTPVRVGIGSDWAMVSAADAGSSFAIKDNGELYAWGDNNNNLGFGDDSTSNIPRRVGTDSDWVSVTTGNGYTHALKSNGSVYAWGVNNSGQLGNGTLIDSNFPIHSDTAIIFSSSASISGLIIDTGDGSRGVDWDILTTTQALPTGTSITIQTRGSDDGTTWPETWDSLSDQTITSPNSRFLEIKIILATDKPETPVLDDFTVNYYAVEAPSNMKQLVNGTELQLGGWNNEGAITLSADVGCENSGCFVEYEVKKAGEAFDGNNTINGNNIESWASGTSSASFTPKSVTSYTWRARAVEFSGNSSAWISYGAGEIAFRIDLTPPTGTITIENGANFTKNSQVNLALTSDDGTGSGVGQMRFSNDGLTWSDWESYSSYKVWDMGRGSGLKSVDLELKDNVGNISGAIWRTKSDFDQNASTTGQGTQKSSIETVGPADEIVEVSLVSNSFDFPNSIVSGASGYDASVGIKSDGTVWSWGGSPLGNGTSNNSDNPVQVHISGEAVKVAADWDIYYALKSDGTVWFWDSDHLTPVQVMGLENVVDIASSSNNSAYALKADGTVWAWGRGVEGQLGYGESISSDVPVQVSNLSDVISITAAGRSAYALKSDGTVWAWGYNGNGVLGIGPSANSNIPVQPDISEVLAISARENGLTVIKENGTVWTWGDNWAGMLGQGTSGGYSDIPIQVPGLMDAQKVVGSLLSTFVLKADGTVWSWGYNGGGDCGVGSEESYILSPTQVVGSNDVVSIFSGPAAESSYFIKGDGSLWGWGWGSDPLGSFNNEEVDYTSPYHSNITVNSYESTSGFLGGLRIDSGVGNKTNWQKINWSGVFPAGTSLKFRTRGSDDGVIWSDWSGYYENSNTTVTTSDSRFLDIKADFSTTLQSASPLLNILRIEAPADSDEIFLDNAAPTIDFDPNNKYPNANWNVKENVNSVELKFNTNKKAVAYAAYGLSDTITEAHGSDVYSTSHSIKLQNLGANTTYKYRIRIFDELGNMGLYPPTGSYEAKTTSADTGFDGSPLVSSMSQVEITASSAKITWKTKVPTSSYVDFGLDTNYGDSAGDESLNTNHVVELKNLTAGKVYHYKVRGKDSAQNEYASSDFTFKAIMNPEISNIQVKELSPYSATITFDTNVSTDSALNFGEGLPYSNREYKDERVNNHTVTLKNLVDMTTYNYQVEIRDEYGNIAKSNNLTFSTPLDTEGPKISDVSIDMVPIESDDTTAQVIVSWKTSKPATARIEYDEGVISSIYSKSMIEDSSLNLSHTSIIKGLKPGSAYHFRIVSKDKRNNETKSTGYAIVTPAQQKSIWQLILKSIEDTFSWVRDMPRFWNNLLKKA